MLSSMARHLSHLLAPSLLPCSFVPSPISTHPPHFFLLFPYIASLTWRVGCILYISAIQAYANNPVLVSTQVVILSYMVRISCYLFTCLSILQFHPSRCPPIPPIRGSAPCSYRISSSGYLSGVCLAQHAPLLSSPSFSPLLLNHTSSCLLSFLQLIVKSVPLVSCGRKPCSLHTSGMQRNEYANKR